VSRSRTLRPDFFRNAELCSLPPLTRILFAGLWTEADRAGRLLDRPRTLKGKLLPYDDCDVETMLDQLAAGPDPFIARYEVRGQRVIHVVTFLKHQTPHPREGPSELPCNPAVKSRGKVRPRHDPGPTPAQPRSDHGTTQARPSPVDLDLDLVSGSRSRSVSGSCSGSAPAPQPLSPPRASTKSGKVSGSQPANREGPEQVKGDVPDPAGVSRWVRKAKATLAARGKMEPKIGPGELKRQLRKRDARLRR